MSSVSELVPRAYRLRALHPGTRPLVLPNLWDVASAQAGARAGATAAQMHGEMQALAVNS